MTSKFIEKRLERMKKSIPGYDFHELAELAKSNPQEFEKRRRQILENEISRLSNEGLEKNKQCIEGIMQKNDPNMDVEESIARSIISSLHGIGDMSEASRDCVAMGAEKVRADFDSVKQIGGEAEKAMEEISSSFVSVIADLSKVADNIKESKVAIESIEIGVAQIESNQIPNREKQ